MYDLVTEKLFGDGKGVRRGPAAENAIYLSFDDGPDTEFTPQVLDMLSNHNAKASFFVIAERAVQNKDLLKRMRREGHAIGNHSADHSYSVFFAGQSTMTKWLKDSEKTLNELLGELTVGFRPPNGVTTPHLVRALEAQSLPLILWSCRFFDTLFTWRESKARSALRRLQSGDIVLLHDRQKENRRSQFLRTLDLFLREGREQGWTFKALPKI